MDATLGLLLVNDKVVPDASSVFVVVGVRRNDASPYDFVMDARVITGVIRATTSVADISNCARFAVAACVAVMTDEPAPMIVTVRPPIVATAGLLLVNVKPTVSSTVVGSVRSNGASPYFLPDGTVKLLNEADTTNDAVTDDPPV
jgi:hypothetical protein